MAFFTSEKFKQKMKAQAARLEEEQMEETSLDADTIFEKVTRDVIGQDRVVRQIANRIDIRSAMQTPDKPLAAMFISGPTGTGKTFMSTKLAEAVYGRKDAILNIDCGTIGEGQEVLTKLFGLPKGYSDAHEGILCDHLKKYPKGSVILFDEFEKAAPNPTSSIAKALLAPIDNGECQTRYGDTRYDTTKCIFILTSNLEQEKLGEVAKKCTDDHDLENQVKATLRQHYSPEFFARFDLVTTVDPLSGEGKMRFIAQKLETIANKFGATIVEAEDGIYDLMVEGAKQWGVKTTRDINRWLETVMAKEIIDAVRKRKIKRLIADYDAETNKFTVRDADEPKPVAAPVFKEPVIENELVTDDQGDEGFEGFSVDDEIESDDFQAELDRSRRFDEDTALDDAEFGDDDDKNREVA